MTLPEGNAATCLAAFDEVMRNSASDLGFDIEATFELLREQSILLASNEEGSAQEWLEELSETYMKQFTHTMISNVKFRDAFHEIAAEFGVETSSASED